MGVLRASSRLRKLGEVASGLRISEGKVPDPGVWREEDAEVLELARRSKPAAAMVAVTVAEAMVVDGGARSVRSKKRRPWAQMNDTAMDTGKSATPVEGGTNESRADKCRA